MISEVNLNRSNVHHCQRLPVKSVRLMHVFEKDSNMRSENETDLGGEFCWQSVQFLLHHSQLGLEKSDLSFYTASHTHTQYMA